MASELQGGYRKLRIGPFGPIVSSPAEPLATQDSNRNDIPIQAASNGSENESPHDLSYRNSTVEAGNALRDPEYVENGRHASTPPVNIPAYSIDINPRAETKSSWHGQQTQEPLSVEEFARKRQPSITFNPHVTLESGHRRGLEEPLPRLETGTNLEACSTTKEESKGALHLSLSRGNSEADRDLYGPITGEIKTAYNKSKSASPEIHLAQKKPRCHRLQPVLYDIATDNRLKFTEHDASLTSSSTASLPIEEVKTPLDAHMSCLASPISDYSDLHQPTSLEESSAWPIPKRHVSNSTRASSYTNERKGSLRQGSRRNSRRSTSTSLSSPATAFLDKWRREEVPPAPDDEGQELGDYVLGREIGHGGFSVVREAFTFEGGKRVCRAVKIVRKQVHGREDVDNEQMQAEFEHEVGLWRCLSHRRILPLLSVYVTDFATFCFTELYSGGTLHSLVKSNRQGLSSYLARRYSYQLASAIRYLHEDVRIAHRDIKLENCLIDTSASDASNEGGKLILCDFGLAEFITSDDTRIGSPDAYENAADRPPPRKIGPSETSTSIAGSLEYASPEMINGSPGLLSLTVDIWAFGVVLYALLTGDLPFHHIFQPRVRMMIIAGEWDRKRLKSAKGVQGIEEEITELIEGCLDMESADRWTIAQILGSRWLNRCPEMVEEMREGPSW
ncbi:hypothetical protein MMC20_006427 [Loxospora ochrophaea]|nr:hypothetical protein [Loxospora ochrophaea]